MQQNIVRLAAWAAVIAIGVLSLVPGELRPHLAVRGHLAPGFLEHIAAYLVTGMLLSLGYSRRSLAALLVPLSLYAVALEIAQFYVPNREPSVLDWIAGTFGAFIGIHIANLNLTSRLRQPDAIDKKAEQVGP
jgi:hypothetical protein